MKTKNYDFQCRLECNRATGAFVAAYFQVRVGHAEKTKELVANKVLANYNKHGELLGVEFLAPCKVAVVDKLEPQAAAFIRGTAPSKLLLAG